MANKDNKTANAKVEKQDKAPESANQEANNDKDACSEKEELLSSIEELRKRVVELEQWNFKQGVYAGAIGLILLATFGITFVQLPATARDAANKQLPKLVEEEAKKKLPNLVATQAALQLPTLVDAKAQQKLPDMLDKTVPGIIQSIVKERTQDFERLRVSLLQDLLVVSNRTGAVETTVDSIEKKTSDLVAQGESLSELTKRLSKELQAVQSSDSAELVKVINSLKAAPDIESILETQQTHGTAIDGLRKALDRPESHRVLLGHVRIKEVPKKVDGEYIVTKLPDDVYRIQFSKPFDSPPAVCITVARHDQSKSAAADNTVRVDVFNDHCKIYIRDLIPRQAADGGASIDSQKENADFGFLVVGR